MASYSVRHQGQSLAPDRQALAGEEVIITRHGRPVVSMCMVNDRPRPETSREEALDRLRAVRESLPIARTAYLDVKRLDEADGLL